MLCSNCHESHYSLVRINKDCISPDGVKFTLTRVRCLRCPICREVIFTQEQAETLQKRFKEQK